MSTNKQESIKDVVKGVILNDPIKIKDATAKVLKMKTLETMDILRPMVASQMVQTETFGE